MSEAADVEFEQLRARLVGHRFPGGTFTVAGYERWLSHDAMLAPTIPDPLLHPVWILLGALRGMGMSIDELIELAGPGPHDGVVFGETTLEQLRPLARDETYRVHGEIVELRRRQGRRAGLMDLLTFRLELEGLGAASCRARKPDVRLPAQGAFRCRLRSPSETRSARCRCWWRPRR